MKARKKHFIVSVDVFDANVYVLVNFTMADVKKQFRNDPKLPRIMQGIGDLRDDALGGVLDLGGAPIVVLRLAGEPAYKVASIVAHEALHICCRILHGAGITMSDESEEVYAYLCGYLTEEILRRVRS